ncbi:hypothetical protein AB1Y20_015881 [Prymnesium parvum]|uniref:Uncharacterized protein n=1 Tax=Prymnesium parvum TaxID=97485 RepID=A0AB34K1T9_PRYPA|mmetsp:Transcript_14406/g.36005  ORF Transcript_14406/g.36005 Transcript_14406/m.36005 type:complete len:471 (-) Transcript_14406:546-1958(-)
MLAPHERLEEADQLLPLEAEGEWNEEPASLAGDAAPLHSRRSEPAPAPSLRLSLVYWGVYAVNGGIVGALGPSLEAFERSTGLTEAAMGQMIMQNRLAKVVGVGLWTLYTKHCYAKGRACVGTPHVMLSLALLMSSLCNAVIAHMSHHEAAIRLALVLAGVTYGITDTGIVLLTLWRYNHSDRQQRTAVAMLNAAFTVGALLTPVLVAASLKRTGDARIAFDAICGVALLLASILPLFTPPHQPANAMGGGAGEDSTHRKPRSACNETLLLGSMCVILCCVTGSEHAVATWLSSFGVEVGGMSESTMALMSSFFWGFICTGRLVWCVASELITTAWPMLFMDIAFMLSGSLAFVAYTLSPAGNNRLLWGASMLMALGVSSSLPCAITLPRETNVQITPGALLAFNVGGTLGETLFPCLIGMAFERKSYLSLGVLLTSSQAAALLSALIGLTAVAGLRRAAGKGKAVVEPK